MTNEEFERVCFSLISASGMAKSNYIQAIQAARGGDFDQADVLVKQADEFLLQAHAPHAEMVQQEAAGNHVEVNILLMHAEDQMATTESFKVMAQEFIALYRERETGAAHAEA